MKASVFKPLGWLALLVLAVSLACNAAAGTSTPAAPTAALATSAPPTQAPPTVAPTQAEAQPTAAPTTDNLLVSNLQDVKKATIQIQSQGSFIDPQVGVVQNGAGRGSGFIIDPSGLAVTNNHVVTGSALLKVWMGGDQSKTYNAKVLGVSECSDLAVIKIEGSNFPYLTWHNGSVDVGTETYVAGYPLGDPEYSLSKGIISKAKADGKTSWSSVQSVIEYDANTNPGNSGGPVVDANGNVMGIHYAGLASARQSFGISEEIAKGVIDQLKEGKSLETIGVNGQAVVSDDGSLSGVWVASVQSGSPADKAGVKGGDIITKMENLDLAQDGTMADYCDILRSHNEDDTLSIQVLRFASGEVLEGQLNGRELAVVSQVEVTPGTGDGTPTGDLGNANATNSGDYFFSTEFDSEANWYTFAVPKSDNYDATVDQSKLFIQVNETNSSVYALYELDLVPSDVRIDTGVETVSGPNRNNISLICRATDAGWYEFSMNSGGYWYIWKYENGKYNMLNNGASNAINRQKSKNEITATCIGTDLTLYVNQTKMGSARDNRFKDGGQVGVSVSTFDIAGAGVEFDWFAATVP